ncbi:MAG: pilus assembly protein PilM, partial [Phycisphaerae bacterium]|nr:pilus assembly protein PilM [Phycisphaerae bacterium]
MAAVKAVWGIDLGQCALKAIKLQMGENGVEAVDCVYHEHAKILSQPDVDRGPLIDEAMKKLTDQHELSKETIVVGVPGQHTLARFTKLPPVDAKKIPQMVDYEARQQIPFDLDEVIWDYQTFTNGEGETEVGIFAMRRELLRNHLHFVAGFDLEPAAVQAGPLALYNALKYDGICGTEPIAILDIGTQNSDLIVAEGGSLWTRNIPIGGNAFSDALSK